LGLPLLEFNFPATRPARVFFRLSISFRGDMYCLNPESKKMFFFIRLIFVLCFAAWVWLFFTGGGDIKATMPDSQSIAAKVKNALPDPRKVGEAVGAISRPTEVAQKQKAAEAPTEPDDPAKPKIRIH